MLLLLSFGLALSTDVCMVGFVMDEYCINRGTLLDNPSKETLQNADIHSIHCLVDPKQCWSSGFEILADPEQCDCGDADSKRPKHCRAYKLDSAGDAKVLFHARALGAKDRCYTCTNETSGALDKGYRATVTGKVIDASTSPPTLGDVEVFDSSVGCPNGIVLPAESICASGGDKNSIVLHGTLMLLSWGLMLPSGVIAARFLRHRKGSPGSVPLWFRMHKILQPTGLVVAIIGWAIALTRFNVLEAGAGKALVHASLGMVTMILGIMQPLNAFFRPHKQAGKPVTTMRRAWEILHKGSGYLAVFLGLVTVGLGTVLAKEVKIPELQSVYIAFLVFLAAFLVMAVIDGQRQGSNVVNDKEAIVSTTSTNEALS